MKYIFLIITSIILLSCNQNNNNTILTKEETSDLLSKNKRKQIISLNRLLLLDTTNSIYLIPVGQKFLDKAENIEDESTLGLMNFSRYKNRGYHGYNNFLLYFEKERKTVNIFNDRFLLNLSDIRNTNSDIILIFEGINKDSNKNGEYDSDDIKSLFVFSLQNEKLVEIFEPYNHLVEYNIIPETKNLIILYGVDRDSNGIFVSKDEPMHYIQFNFETGEKFNIVNDSIMNKMQKILEGRE